MAFNSSWIPDEDSQTLFSERCWLQGTVITAIAYGITLPLYFLSFLRLVRHGDNHARSSHDLLLLIFITVSGVLGTLYMITLTGFTQMIFIDDRDYPGGPNAFKNNMFYVPINYTGLVAYFVSSWLCDTIVVWRFKVIYQACGVPLWMLMIFPCLLLAGSVAMSITFLIYLEAKALYASILADFGRPFLILSLALNVILTLAIVLRLLSFRYRIVSIMGPQYGTRYTSVVAMIVESATLYSTMSIVYLVLFESQTAVSQVFLQSLNQFQTIAALLIVFRVARGKGWTQNTVMCMMESGSDPSDLESIRFASPGASAIIGSFVEGVGSRGGARGENSRQGPLMVDLRQ